MARKPSVDFCGYWQRHISALLRVFNFEQTQICKQAQDGWNTGAQESVGETLAEAVALSCRSRGAKRRTALGPIIRENPGQEDV